MINCDFHGQKREVYAETVFGASAFIVILSIIMKGERCMKRLTDRLLSIAAACTLAFTALLQQPADAFAAMNTSEFDVGYSYSTEFRGLTAMQLVSDMGVGWNLGNTLESEGSETGWGNPVTTKSMIDAVAAKGVTTLRVPVRWDDHYSDPSQYKISDDFMDRVETVVNYGLANDMYVILNVHHCDLQCMVSTDSSTKQRVKTEFSAIWEQVGSRFKNYGDKLIFEVNNEPRSAETDWSGSSAAYAVVNQYNEAAIRTIRATGGNNSKRLVMLPTYAASADAPKVEAWENPTNDPMVAASIHAYVPNGFAMINDSNHYANWTDNDEAVLDNMFNRLYNKFIANGTPVVIGEFGATNKDNLSDRNKFTAYYTKLANSFAEQKIPCAFWDNGVPGPSTSEGEKYGLLDRNSRTFIFPTIIEAAVNSFDAVPDAETVSTGKNVLFSGTATCAAYKQAVTLEPDMINTIKQAGGIYVKYTADTTPEIVLQGGIVSGNWGKWYQISPDSVKNNVAYWSYDSLKNGYNDTEYSGYTDLAHIFVAATDSELKVTEVYLENGTAHTHSYDGTAIVTLPATATTEGRATIPCSVSGCTAYEIVTLPATGVSGGTDDNEDDVSTFSMTYVNPLYSDVITESDLNPLPQVTAYSLPSTYTTVDDAGTYVRGQMKSRAESITFKFEFNYTDSSTLGDLAKSYGSAVMDAAQKHTGVPTEGDYIMWQYAGWQSQIGCSYGGGKCTATYIVVVTYYDTAEQESEVDAAVSALLEELDLSDKTDYEKITAVHNWICNNVTYDYTNLNNNAYTLKYTAYAALINRTAVCQGYANLFYRLMTELGVDCRIISGTSNNQPHAWNIVKINGKYYNLDSTWDAGKTSPQYLLKCNSNFPDHARDSEYTTTAFNTEYPMSDTDYTESSGDTPVTTEKPNPPSFAVKGVFGGRNVTFNCTTPGTTIYYTTENRSELKLTDPHVAPGDTVLFTAYYGTVYARAYCDGQWSNPARLILKIPKVNTPTITKLSNGKYKISTTTPGTIVYYTIDGTTPSADNYKGKFWTSHDVTIPAGKTVKAIAVRTCFSDSDIATAKT